MKSEHIDKFYLQHEIIQAYVRVIFIALLLLALLYFAFYSELGTLAYTNKSYLFAFFYGGCISTSCRPEKVPSYSYGIAKIFHTAY